VRARRSYGKRQLMLPRRVYTLDGVFGKRNRTRTHLSIGNDAQEAQEIQPPERGKLIEIVEAGGLTSVRTKSGLGSELTY
jgi:hypothetical protein